MTGGQIIEKNTRIRLKIVGTRVDATEIVSQVQTSSSMKVAKAQRSSRLALSRRTTLVSLINSVDSRVGFHVYPTPLVACIEDRMCYLDRWFMRNLPFTHQGSSFSETTCVRSGILPCERLSG